MPPNWPIILYVTLVALLLLVWSTEAWNAF